MKVISYDPSPGEDISHAIRHSITLAKQKKCRVRFRFNDTILEATPKKSPASMLQEWDLVRGRKAEAWRGSREGQKFAAERKARSDEAVSTVASQLSALPAILLTGSYDRLMQWLAIFAPAADHVDAKFDTEALAVELEKVGFKNNDHVGQPPEWFTSGHNPRERTGQYIVGQCINCLRIGMPPHPMTITFVERYFALPEWPK